MCALCKGEPKRGEWDTDRHCAGDTLITHTYNIQPVVRRGTAPGRTTRPGGCRERARGWRRRRAGAPAALRREKCHRFHDFHLNPAVLTCAPGRASRGVWQCTAFVWQSAWCCVGWCSCLPSLHSHTSHTYIHTQPHTIRFCDLYTVCYVGCEHSAASPVETGGNW